MKNARPSTRVRNQTVYLALTVAQAAMLRDILGPLSAHEVCTIIDRGIASTDTKEASKNEASNLLGDGVFKVWRALSAALTPVQG